MGAISTERASSGGIGRRRTPRRARSRAALAWLATAGALVACGEHRGALDPGSGGALPSGAGAAGEAGDAAASVTAGVGGTPSPPAAGAGEGGMDPGGTAGASSANGGARAGEGGAAGTPPPGGGDGGVAGEAGAPPSPNRCNFHTAPSASSGAGGAEEGGGGAAGSISASDGGEGGAPPIFDVTVARSGFVGDYLADETGLALYAYGGDFAGDCENPPISGCLDDCLLNWPIFEAGERRLAPGLDDALFGSFERSDGARQTTYRGWPLYYFHRDVLPGDTTGQAVGRIWHLAETVLPNVVIVRVDTARSLADEDGRSLYVFEEDQAGSSEADPVSLCGGACLVDFSPFWVSVVAPVSYLEIRDFSSFVRPDGARQIAYKGSPLYTSSLDSRSGDRNGLTVEGFLEATP